MENPENADLDAPKQHGFRMVGWHVVYERAKSYGQQRPFGTEGVWVESGIRALQDHTGELHGSVERLLNSTLAVGARRQHKDDDVERKDPANMISRILSRFTLEPGCRILVSMRSRWPACSSSIPAKSARVTHPCTQYRSPTYSIFGYLLWTRKALSQTD